MPTFTKSNDSTRDTFQIAYEIGVSRTVIIRGRIRSVRQIANIWTSIYHNFRSVANDFKYFNINFWHLNTRHVRLTHAVPGFSCCHVHNILQYSFSKLLYRQQENRGYVLIMVRIMASHIVRWMNIFSNQFWKRPRSISIYIKFTQKYTQTWRV